MESMAGVSAVQPELRNRWSLGGPGRGEAGRPGCGLQTYSTPQPLCEASPSQVKQLRQTMPLSRSGSDFQ